MAGNPTESGPGAKGIALFKAGDNDAALPQLRQAVHESPDHFELRMFFGLALAKAEKWADAESQFSTAYDLNSNSAEAAYFQGVAIAKRGRLLEAHNMFKVALAINPEHKGAQAAVQATQGAAEQVTTEGSSARMPGGANLTVGDWGAIEAEAAKLEGRPAKPKDDLSSALAELEGKQQPAAGGARKPAESKPAPAKSGGGANIKMAHKNGCGSLIALCLVGLPLLGVLISQLL